MTEPSRSGLTDEMSRLLRGTVANHAPDLLPLAESVGEAPLGETDREALRSAVLAEFLSAGRDSNDEATSYGLKLEKLIDALGHC